MQFVVGHFVSGAAFFTGAAVLAVGVTLAGRASPRWSTMISVLLGLLGFLMLLLSGTPLPAMFYGGMGVLLAAWLVVLLRSETRDARVRVIITVLIVAALAAGVAVELPHHLPPRLPHRIHSTLFVIGDSISAGIRRGEIPWPQLLEKRQEIRVVDFSEAGAGVQSALSAARKLGREEGLVVLEIGGNDILGKTPVSDFERDLNALLEMACQEQRTVVMLELPVPILANAYGAAQRRQARLHHVTLIPKRWFTAILVPRANTLDGLHLSQKGQDQMADMIWRHIAPVMRPAPRPASGQDSMKWNGQPLIAGLP